MRNRALQEWALVVLVLVVAPLVAVSVLVASVVHIVGAVGAIATDLFDCTDEEWLLAEQLTDDAAAEEILTVFPKGPPPHEACDPDDDTVSVDVERRTGLPRAEALAAGRLALDDGGWRDLGACHTKRIEGRRVWASLAYRDEYRSDAASDLLLSMVTVRSYAC
ncbi:hypothetical protein FXB39_05225 [Nocardioides sp. BGMRC 2183]|nr:hypothetical protein FXB39_05225 [Nocardioides sp. BGMRC 2183]